jgi:hypothetical protein
MFKLNPVTLLILLLTLSFNTFAQSFEDLINIRSSLVFSAHKINHFSSLDQTIENDLAELASYDLTELELDQVLDEVMAELLINATELEREFILTRFFNGIKDQVRLLARRDGLAVAIAFLVTEILEWPLKAAFIAAGRPELAILMEVGRVEIIIPFLVASLKKSVERLKVRRVVGAQYIKQHNKFKRQSKKAGEQAKDLYLRINQTDLRLKPHRSFTNVASLFYLAPNKLSLVNLRRFLKQADFYSDDFRELLKRKDLSKTERLVLSLNLLAGQNEVLFNELVQKFDLVSSLNLSTSRYAQDLFQWSTGMFNLDEKAGKLKMGFCSTLLDGSHPYQIYSLWHQVIYPHMLETWGKGHYRLFKHLRKFNLSFEILALKALLHPYYSKTWNDSWCREINQLLD